MARTILYEKQLKENAKFVDFHGWELPIFYTSIKNETLGVRQSLGIFDVSHMGQVYIEGDDAEKFVNYLITNTTYKKENYSIVYALFCNTEGFIIDDLLVYKYNNNKFLLVINASNIDKDFNWIMKNVVGFNVIITNVSNEYSMLAIQGPKSINLLDEFFSDDLNKMKYYSFIETRFNDIACILSRTGYTGEIGFEIIVKNEVAGLIWDNLLKFKNKYNLFLCGLGSRDILRIEAGYPLYGQELSDTINPFESNLDWVVKLDHQIDFIGKRNLKDFKNNNNKSRIGFIMDLNKVARENSLIMDENENKIGIVTSGTFSFNLNKSIGMGIIEKKLVDIQKLKININGKFYTATINKLPFIKSL